MAETLRISKQLIEDSSFDLGITVPDGADYVDVKVSDRPNPLSLPKFIQVESGTNLLQEAS